MVYVCSAEDDVGKREKYNHDQLLLDGTEYGTLGTLCILQRAASSCHIRRNGAKLLALSGIEKVLPSNAAMRCRKELEGLHLCW